MLVNYKVSCEIDASRVTSYVEYLIPNCNTSFNTYARPQNLANRQAVICEIFANAAGPNFCGPPCILSTTATLRCIQGGLEK